MSQTARRDLHIALDPTLPQTIAAALWQMDDNRRETLKVIGGLTQETLDWEPDGYLNSIGTLLYHIAAVEADWLVVEVLQTDYTRVESWFPHDIRTADGRLTPIKSVPLDEHLARFAFVRDSLLEVFRAMSAEDFRRPRTLERYDVTPEWVLHHLVLHEAEHRGEIMMLQTLARLAHL